MLHQHRRFKSQVCHISHSIHTHTSLNRQYHVCHNNALLWTFTEALHLPTKNIFQSSAIFPWSSNSAHLDYIWYIPIFFTVNRVITISNMYPSSTQSHKLAFPIQWKVNVKRINSVEKKFSLKIWNVDSTCCKVHIYIQGTKSLFFRGSECERMNARRRDENERCYFLYVGNK